ncbi:TcmI family type II polyketide cyclase, partial [Streptomyces sp. NPDC047985]|uniref:TcmI family type II polyketide cyclase n=1 Tax=Streptomyces sp. NPDC047985 TaxID=3155384 RepID=UPI00342F5FE8
FAASDSTELPHLVGVTRRKLFQFGDVYLHLIAVPGPGRHRARASGSGGGRLAATMGPCVLPASSRWCCSCSPAPP